jgi:glycosyltransferase involved in cell wall biosynthesis/GT2 family glycosyltransferase
MSASEAGLATTQDADILTWTDDTLAPAFWRPARLDAGSAWFGHVPFGHWIAAVHRPKNIVELGTHNGISYAAFCEAVLREKLDARAIAIDTWEGDEHAGFYGRDVLQSLRQFHDQRYGSFSTLMQCKFDDALDFIGDGSIDLLHIDGRHRYEDAAHDFHSWRCKLSSRGVVLFHDTNVRERDFGVWRLWAELHAQHPGFEFLHAYGLGVLAVGPKVDGPVAALCALTDSASISSLRERFATLGERWIAERDILDLRQEVAAVRADLAQAGLWGQAAQDEVNRLFPLNQHLSQAHRDARARLAQLQYDLAAAETRLANLDQLREELQAERDRAAILQARLDEAMAHNAGLEHSRDVMMASTSWRITAPLRKVAGRLKPGQIRVQPQPLALPPPPAPAQQDSGTEGAAPDTMETPRRRSAIRAVSQGERPRMLYVSGEDHTPGNVYRVERYTESARQIGFDANWKPAAFVGLEDLVGMSVVVIWRAPLNDHISRVISISRDEGATVIFDVDDLMFRPELAVAKIIDAIRVQRLSEDATQSFFWRIFKTIEQCDLVTCPTEELAHQLRHLGRPAYVLPNGFDHATRAIARRAMRDWNDIKDDLLRIGYASGTRTHQRDFAIAVPAIARLLREHPAARLTLFVDSSSGEGVVLADEFPELKDLQHRIEWRGLVKLADLPKELARFAINIAPLETGNEFCEAKSELKFFEAALAGVPTIASPTGPFKRAIIHGVTGMLAANDDEWYAALSALIADPATRDRMAQAAYHASLAHFGPEARAEALELMHAQLQGGKAGAAAFQRERYRASLASYQPPHVPQSETLLLRDRRGQADVTVIIPTYNYADFVVETLESVAHQTLQPLDLIVIDDASTDDSAQMVLNWAGAHEGRFNRIAVLRHRANAGLGFTRNSGFAAAETDYVLPVDADNRLRPGACETLLAHMMKTEAAFVYPDIQQFGTRHDIFSSDPYSVLRMQPGNYIDAMALIRKASWAAVGGYDHIPLGWEDFDFWCRLAERGHFGLSVPEVLADYRVHAQSMLHTVMRVEENENRRAVELMRRHPWLDLRITPGVAGGTR